ncbi:MAG: penicillin-binding protein 1A [Gammaproteobacteria bacterium]|nr:penicillin-binding protein 1A [Gammaproteobacteria bacterium]
MAVAVLILAAAAATGVALYVIPGLPSIASLRDVQLQVPLHIYTGDGSLIAEFGEKRRIPVAIADVPPLFVNAFIAAEDDRFFDHPGVDWQGILRAAVNLALTGEKTQGGSTITMQVARNFFLTREKSYLRKLNEIFLALKIEQELNKDEILELYLNKIYLGQRAYGIGAAAQVYYGADVGALDLAQMAMIAGLPKAPSTTNPISNLQRALQRREYVLGRMLELGFISNEQYQQASSASSTASLHAARIPVEAPYVAEAVRREIIEKYGEPAYEAGYRVFTTIRDRHQSAANSALRSALLNYDERHGFRGAERHFDLHAEQNGPEHWPALLEGFAQIADLRPALVTGVMEMAVTAILPGSGQIEIPWTNLQWARRYVSENQRGPAPKTAGEILQAGDVIRVRPDENGGWRLSQLPDVEGALVSMRPDDGAVFALVGGFDFARSKFDRALQAQRQPGSSFKPFIYSAALESGFTAASMVNDAPVVFDDVGLEDAWRPENYSGKYYGPTRLREALTHSRNLVSIRLLHAMGVAPALEHLVRFGFEPGALPHSLSLALGSGTLTPYQLAAAYCVFANGGYRVQPYLVERIETLDGKILYQAAPPTVCRDCVEPPAPRADSPTDTGTGDSPGAGGVTAPQHAAAPAAGAATAQPPASQPLTPGGLPIAARAINAENIWIMNSMTRDVIRSGTGRRALELNRPDLSGKTGTTNDQRDAWFAGFNPSITTVTWVGFDKFAPLGGLETGARAALPMWIDFMRIALQDVPEQILPRPPGLVNVRIDPHTGQIAGAGSSGAIFEVFRAGTAPTETSGNTAVVPAEAGVDTEEPAGQLF